MEEPNVLTSNKHKTEQFENIASKSNDLTVQSKEVSVQVDAFGLERFFRRKNVFSVFSKRKKSVDLLCPELITVKKECSQEPKSILKKDVHLEGIGEEEPYDSSRRQYESCQAISPYDCTNFSPHCNPYPCTVPQEACCPMIKPSCPVYASCDKVLQCEYDISCPPNYYAMKLRSALVRGVLMILFFQLVAFIVVICTFLHVDQAKYILGEKKVILYVFIALFFLSGALLCIRFCRHCCPVNVLTIVSFTVSVSYIETYLSRNFVMKALYISLGLCIALSILIIFFACVCHFDATPHYWKLLCLLLLLCVYSLVILIIFILAKKKYLTFKIYNYMQIAYAVFVILIFMPHLFLCYQLVLGCRYYEIDYTDYCQGAFYLFFDIIMIFHGFEQCIGRIMAKDEGGGSYHSGGHKEENAFPESEL